MNMHAWKCRYGTGNQEDEIYTPRDLNSFVTNGQLVIQALREEYKGYVCRVILIAPFKYLDSHLSYPIIQIRRNWSKPIVSV